MSLKSFAEYVPGYVENFTQEHRPNAEVYRLRDILGKSIDIYKIEFLKSSVGEVAIVDAKFSDNQKAFTFGTTAMVLLKKFHYAVDHKGLPLSGTIRFGGKYYDIK